MVSYWILISLLPYLNTACNPYYHFAIASIQAVGQGIDAPGPRDIQGELLDNNKKLQKWIASYQNKWPVYRLTVTYEGWIIPTRQSITNFLIYCDRKIFFQKSINTSN